MAEYRTIFDSQLNETITVEVKYMSGLHPYYEIMDPKCKILVKKILPREISDEYYCNKNIDELSEDEYKTIENRMYPGQFSQVGFLNNGEKLSDIIRQDRQTLEKINISYEQIVSKLKIFVDLYNNNSSGEYQTDKFIVSGKTYKGYQECPFWNTKYRSSHGSQDITVYNKTLGEGITFPSLIVHLIEHHHFFEGNTEYRVDPEKLVRVLEIGE